MFSKIDKKILAALIIILVVVILAGVVACIKLAQDSGGVQDLTGGAMFNLDGVQVENDGGAGGMIICSDRCGDDVCHIQDSDCPEGNMNCICPETPEECPQDCQ